MFECKPKLDLNAEIQLFQCLLSLISIHLTTDLWGKKHVYIGLNVENLAQNVTKPVYKKQRTLVETQEVSYGLK